MRTGDALATCSLSGVFRGGAGGGAAETRLVTYSTAEYYYCIRIKRGWRILCR